MQNNVLRMALGIYEQEIQFFGGSVDYTGKVIRRGLFSNIEETEIILNGVKTRALMERYRDGSAVVYDSEKGLARCGYKGMNYSTLYKTFYSLSQNNARHLSYYFFRRARFCFWGSLQLCSIIGMLISAYYMMKLGVLPILVILFLVALALFALVNKFYSCVRTESVFTHTSFLLKHRCNGETDDFWNID